MFQALKVVDLLVAGGGVAGAWAALTFKKYSPEGRVLLVSDEEPYRRAAIVKLVKNPGSRLQVLTESLQKAGVETLEGRVVEADPAGEAAVETAEGEKKVAFKRLLLATGGKPGLLKVSNLNLKGVFTFRRRRDALQLGEYVKPGQHAFVVGGGLIGLEVAEALYRRGLKVTVVK
ncbi:MAG: hypothetical protein DRO46_02310, partial [Candidatus Hecatellales archaeon]